MTEIEVLIWQLILAVIITIFYMVLGIGFSRTLARAEARQDISLLEIFLWPLLLVICAAHGKLR